jgi:hypothetical protein
MLRRILALWTACLVLVLAGCARRATETASSSTSDSLIASNPTEQSPGQLTPQAPIEQAPPVVRRPPPRSNRAPSSTSSPSTETAESPQPAQAKTPEGPGVVVRWGSFLRVTFTQAVTSETAQVGDAWTGVIKDPVTIDDQVVLPTGSTVQGVVKEVKPAQAGDRAMLTLAVTSVEVGGRTWPVDATMEPLIAESTRARNLGAIAGSAAAGALIGSAVGGSKGGVVGGLVGGAAAGAGVAKSKGYQVVVKSGTTWTFKVARDAVIHLPVAPVN